MIYCISDIHGYYEKFVDLLKIIQFSPPSDVLYVLGDAIDRGPQPVECLMFIIKTHGIHFLPGNHEQMMLDSYDCKNDLWRSNNNEITKKQLSRLTECERIRLLSYVRTRPYYRTIAVNKKRYFLSHSGLAVALPFKYQTPRDLIWNRERFYKQKALKRHICVFGHTPTFYIRGNDDHSVWFDPVYNDKICIDCGCAYGGFLAALRLDDGVVFYC